MSTALSSTLYSIMIFGGVVGPFFWGYLSDRMARKPLVIGVLPAQGVLFYSLQLLRAPLIRAAVLFLIGFMSQTVIMQSILADSIERQHLDQVFGFYYTLGFTLGSVSSVIFAYVVETLGFASGFTYIATVIAVSLVPALFIRELRASDHREPSVKSNTHRGLCVLHVFETKMLIRATKGAWGKMRV